MTRKYKCTACFDTGVMHTLSQVGDLPAIIERDADSDPCLACGGTDRIADLEANVKGFKTMRVGMEVLIADLEEERDYYMNQVLHCGGSCKLLGLDKPGEPK